MSMVRVLERLGHRVHYDPAQTCCGQPAFNSGYREDTARAARHFLDVFDRVPGEYIVAPSGSCTTMVSVFYRDLPDLDREYLARAERVRARLREFSVFLVDELGVSDVGAEFHARVTVHDSCHALRELGISGQPRQLLSHVKGLEVVEMNDADVCCGFGGTFAVKFPELSASMAESKVDNIAAAGVDYVTGVDSSCLMNIEGMLRRKGSPVRALHLADILAGETA
jgi:L-lactate dehydrogenase complex protein LldE